MNSLTDLPSESSCHRHFYQLLWGDLTCAECNQKGLKFRKNYEYCPHCHKKMSCKAHSKFFAYSNLTFRQIFVLIWCWQHNCAIGETCKIVGLSYPAVSTWLRRFRQALPRKQQSLAGLIEVDGSYFGKRKFGRQKLVIGAINPKTQQIRLKVIPIRNSHYAESFIKTTIKQGSVVITDEFPGYNNIEDLGYLRFACNHSQGVFGPTNHIEALWSKLKRALRYAYRDLAFNAKDLDLILIEYENRHNRPELFYNEDTYIKMVCSRFFS